MAQNIAQKFEKQQPGVKVQIFDLVVPFNELKNASIRDPSVHTDIKVYKGLQELNEFGVGAHGSGTFVKGHLEGTIISYDYKALYDVYHLTDYNQASKYWFVEYKKAVSHDELKKAHEDAKTTTVKAELDFTIQGNDYDISTVFVYYQVIRLEVEGVKKDFVVTNPSSSEPRTPSGDPYPGEYAPV
jgi:hypothetical protein